ncbi:AraC-like DNA-binding protein [Arthrobacter woluwensis]|uniref:AraC family transcriptional regulator n=1 Tax=Arthrobacter woluwensis TaxID=156980 RepID=UPI00278A147B|nr:AraC family transcriptional regulator [Arthrobacter woluwensis]MDQ0708540.1 AraC-like DNA-binding protein [Arthrobacter woluwensis]
MTEFWRSTELPHLESRRSCQAVSCYRPHTHDRFSIGLIDAGQALFAGAGGTRCELEPGDVLLIPAHTVHSCNRQTGLWTYQMIHADQDWITSLLPNGATRLLDGVAVFREPGLHRAFTRINDGLFRGEDPARVETLLAEALAGCVEFTPFYSGAASPESGTDSPLTPVLDRLRSSEATPSLDELGGLLGLDKYQLIRAVKDATGLPPIAWRQNDRVIAARALLREGLSPAETAYALGFTDQSHFHRVFRSHVAATPGTYRA